MDPLFEKIPCPFQFPSWPCYAMLCWWFFLCHGVKFWPGMNGKSRDSLKRSMPEPKGLGGCQSIAFYVPQQLSSTSWWQVSTVYGIECTQHLADIFGFRIHVLNQWQPSRGLTIVFLSPGAKFSDRRLLTSAANWQVGHSPSVWRMALKFVTSQITLW